VRRAVRRSDRSRRATHPVLLAPGLPGAAAPDRGGQGDHRRAGQPQPRSPARWYVSADERERAGRDRRQADGLHARVIQNVAVGKRRRAGQPARLRAGRARPHRQAQRADPARRSPAQPRPRRSPRPRASRRASTTPRAPSASSTTRSSRPSAIRPSRRRSAACAASRLERSRLRALPASRGIGEPNDYGNRLLVLSDGAVAQRQPAEQLVHRLRRPGRPPRRGAHRGRPRPGLAALRYGRVQRRRQHRPRGKRRAQRAST
jgi:hypothetical protein